MSDGILGGYSTRNSFVSAARLGSSWLPMGLPSSCVKVAAASFTPAHKIASPANFL